MQLNEKLFQYIWLHRLYNCNNLQTENGEKLQILSPGTWNKNAGPDFLEGKVKVENTLLIGHIELHLKTSDWIKHGHAGNEHYKNLILHVVYEADIKEQDTLPENVPLLVLKDRISGMLLEKYNHLMHCNNDILCSDQLGKIKELTWINWKDRLLIERWQQKTAVFSTWMEETRNDWAETFYRALARNFGLPVNGDAFAAVAQSLPLKILARYKNDPIAVEALLFGQAAMLKKKFKEKYPQQLQKTYHFLQKKHQLTPVQPYLWKWSRMRPRAFPTIRLAQFAAIIHQSAHLFSTLIEKTDFKEVKELFQLKTTTYWTTHYRFDKPSKKHATHLGKNMVTNILINTICPILAMYDRFQLNGEYLDRAFDWMKKLPAENNRYTRKWNAVGQPNKSAWDSQALLQLYKHYCSEKRCLDCAIGFQLLRQ